MIFLFIFFALTMSSSELFSMENSESDSLSLTTSTSHSDFKKKSWVDWLFGLNLASDATDVKKNTKEILVTNRSNFTSMMSLVKEDILASKIDQIEAVESRKVILEQVHDYLARRDYEKIVHFRDEDFAHSYPVIAQSNLPAENQIAFEERLMALAAPQGQEALTTDAKAIVMKAMPVIVKRKRTANTIYNEASNTAKTVGFRNALARKGHPLDGIAQQEQLVLDTAKRMLEDRLFSYDVGDDPKVVRGASHIIYGRIEKVLKAYDENPSATLEQLATFDGKRSAAAEAILKQIETYENSKEFREVFDQKRAADLRRFKNLLKDTIAAYENLHTTPTAVKELSSKYHINLPEYVRVYQTKQQLETAASAFRVLTLLQGQPGEVRGLVESIADAALKMNAQNDTENAQEIISILDMICDGLNGAGQEILDQGLAYGQRVLVGIPLAKGASRLLKLPALRYIAPRLCPYLGTGLMLYNVYNNSEAWIANLLELREALNENRPYDAGRAVVKLNCNSLEAITGYTNLYKSLEEARKKGFFNDAYKAVIKGIKDGRRLKDKKVRQKVVEVSQELDTLRVHHKEKVDQACGSRNLNIKKIEKEESSALVEEIKKEISESDRIQKVMADCFSYRSNIISGFHNEAFKKEHFFSLKHIKGAIMDLGASEADIVEKCFDAIKRADGLNKLIRGQNNIVTTINGHRATIRCNIDADGTFRSWNAFKGISGREVPTVTLE